MRVIVCGDRYWGNRDPLIFSAENARERDYLMTKLDQLLAKYPDLHLVHGGAKGADLTSEYWARVRAIPFTCYPARWSEHGKAAGPIRNKQMLDSGVDMVIAFHRDIESSKGTKHMVTIAEKAGVQTRVLGTKIKNPTPRKRVAKT